MRIDAEKRGGVGESSARQVKMAASYIPASVPLAREYPNFVTHLECSYSGKSSHLGSGSTGAQEGGTDRGGVAGR